jgi:hypothetical protein
MHRRRAAAVGGATLALTVGAALRAVAQKPKMHRVVVQVTQNDPAVMNMALNNVENLVSYFHDKGEKVEVEVVAYGAGLNMMRSDTSPVKDRLAVLSGNKSITFSGCGNTLAKQSVSESKQVSLVPEAHIVSAGIARVVELQEEGWTYVRP